MEIKNGTYSAKINNFGFSLTKNGDLQIVVLFDFDTDKQLSWFGSLKEGKAREITFKTLGIMGFDGSKMAIESISEGPLSGALNLEKEFNIKVENELYDGKTIPKIKWVNDPDDPNTGIKFLAFEEVILKSQQLKLNNDAKVYFSQNKKMPQLNQQSQFDPGF